MSKLEGTNLPDFFCARSPINNMAEEITTLRQRVAELEGQVKLWKGSHVEVLHLLEARNAELEKQLEAMTKFADKQTGIVLDLQGQLAESKKDAKDLRDSILQFRNEPLLHRAVAIRRTAGYRAMQRAAIDSARQEEGEKK